MSDTPRRKAWKVYSRIREGEWEDWSEPTETVVHAATHAEARRIGYGSIECESWIDCAARREPGLDDRDITPKNLIRYGGWTYYCHSCESKIHWDDNGRHYYFDDRETGDEVPTIPVEHGRLIYCSIECLTTRLRERWSMCSVEYTEVYDTTEERIRTIARPRYARTEEYEEWHETWNVVSCRHPERPGYHFLARIPTAKWDKPYGVLDLTEGVPA